MLLVGTPANRSSDPPELAVPRRGERGRTVATGLEGRRSTYLELHPHAPARLDPGERVDEGLRTPDLRPGGPMLCRSELHPRVTPCVKLRNLGSNQDRRIQSTPCFPYTIPQGDGTL